MKNSTILFILHEENVEYRFWYIFDSFFYSRRAIESKLTYNVIL